MTTPTTASAGYRFMQDGEVIPRCAEYKIGGWHPTERKGQMLTENGGDYRVPASHPITWHTDHVPPVATVAPAQPVLVWKRGKPTDQECQECMIMSSAGPHDTHRPEIHDQGETTPEDWDETDWHCVLPPIAMPPDAVVEEPSTPTAPDIRTAARCFANSGYVWVAHPSSGASAAVFRPWCHVWDRASTNTLETLCRGNIEITPAEALAMIPADWTEGREEMLRLFAECVVDDDQAAGDMTAEEADAAYDVAEQQPLSDDEARRLLAVVMQPEPQPFRITGPGVYRRRNGIVLEIVGRKHDCWQSKCGFLFKDGGRLALRMTSGEHVSDIVARVDEPADIIPQDSQAQRDGWKEVVNLVHSLADTDGLINSALTGEIPVDTICRHIREWQSDAAKWRALDLSGVPSDCEFLGVRKCVTTDTVVDADGTSFAVYDSEFIGDVRPIIRRISPPTPPDTPESLLREVANFLANFPAGAYWNESVQQRVKAVLGREAGR